MERLIKNRDGMYSFFMHPKDNNGYTYVYKNGEYVVRKLTESEIKDCEKAYRERINSSNL